MLATLGRGALTARGGVLCDGDVAGADARPLDRSISGGIGGNRCVKSLSVATTDRCCGQ